MAEDVDVYTSEGIKLYTVKPITTSISGIEFDGLYYWITDNVSTSSSIVKQMILASSFSSVSSFDIQTTYSSAVISINGICTDGKDLWIAFEQVVGPNIFSVVGKFDKSGNYSGFNAVGQNKASYGTIRDITFDGYRIVVSASLGATHKLSWFDLSGANREVQQVTASRPILGVCFNGVNYVIVMQNIMQILDVDGDVLWPGTGTGGGASPKAICMLNSGFGKYDSNRYAMAQS